jgi:hypothetical protein
MQGHRPELMGGALASSRPEGLEAIKGLRTVGGSVRFQQTADGYYIHTDSILCHLCGVLSDSGFLSGVKGMYREPQAKKEKYFFRKAVHPGAYGVSLFANLSR